MANNDEGRAQDSSTGSSGAVEPARAGSPPSQDHDTKDGPSQYEPQQPMTTDASPEKQHNDTSGQKDQDSPNGETASGDKSKSTKEKPSFKHRVHKFRHNCPRLCFAFGCMCCTCGLSVMATDGLID